MNTNKNHKRKRGHKPMVDGDVSSAQAVTFKTTTETRRDGTTFTKRVLVSLDSQPENVSTAENYPAEDFSYNLERDNNSPPPTERTHPYRVGIYHPLMSLLMIFYIDPKRLLAAICRSY